MIATPSNTGPVVGRSERAPGTTNIPLGIRLVEVHRREALHNARSVTRPSTTSMRRTAALTECPIIPGHGGLQHCHLPSALGRDYLACGFGPRCGVVAFLAGVILPAEGCARDHDKTIDAP